MNIRYVVPIDSMGNLQIFPVGYFLFIFFIPYIFPFRFSRSCATHGAYERLKRRRSGYSGVGERYINL